MSATPVLNSQYRYAAALQAALGRASTWLDLGCGHQFVPEWIPKNLQVTPVRNQLVVGVDADATALRAHRHLHLRIIGSIEVLPIATGSFDLVTANMVLEHVQRPDLLFREVHRVLKTGGTFLVHTPNRSGYTTTMTRAIPARWRPRLAGILQGRHEHDVYPTFYRANTVQTLKQIANRSALSVGDLRTIESSPQLYQVPVLRSIEEHCLRLFRAESLARWRPCILGEFWKPREDQVWDDADSFPKVHVAVEQ